MRDNFLFVFLLVLCHINCWPIFNRMHINLKSQQTKNCEQVFCLQCINLIQITYAFCSRSENLQSTKRISRWKSFRLHKMMVFRAIQRRKLNLISYKICDIVYVCCMQCFGWSDN